MSDVGRVWKSRVEYGREGKERRREKKEKNLVETSDKEERKNCGRQGQWQRETPQHSHNLPSGATSVAESDKK